MSFRNSFGAEVAAYGALREQQAKSVAELFAAVNINLHTDTSPAVGSHLAPGVANSLDFHPFQVKGILLQDIEGLPYAKSPSTVPVQTGRAS